MRLSVLASGSSGNATLVEARGASVLVDAGISCRRLRGLVERLGRRLESVDAVLVTHGHSDHTSGIRRLVRECGTEVYAGPGVAEEIGARRVEAGEALDFGGLVAEFFPVPHDSPACGIRLSGGERTVALATDLGEVTPEVLERLRGAAVVVLEANHDPEWLWHGPYPERLKRRVASERGHLSNVQAAEAALALASGGLEDLVLAHLSRTNNSPARALGTVRRVLRAAGFERVRVHVARRERPIPWVGAGGRTAVEPALFDAG
ncbi:MBL fold metallo-hydrolase [Rubrobacter taiwanensis]|uniref:MBL fold metallo-hydrolase n=1 Tax=Rubrobacter taiwanensis TaxID=185139 RepID=A0A4R1BPI8_9ACTN|nr:MBL fold metallo-hydrolase [Rubrobacter taiwanensis]TCJ19398.1 MBL fold metallo-hydrolase [Rubrobacter taiwanensis]